METEPMESCTLNGFMAVLQPWLNDDYVAEAYVNEHNQVVLQFTDGVKKIFRIDDCTAHQLAAVLEDLRSRGIAVHMGSSDE